MRLQLPLVPIEEQQSIGRIIECANSTVSALKTHLAKITALKAALMQDLLTGKKRVTALLEPEEQKREKVYAGH